MDPGTRVEDVRQLRKDKRMLGTALMLTAFGLILSMLMNLKQLGNERTVLESPGVSQKFWVTGSTASQDYLEEMAGYFSWLILDVSPGNIDWKKENLLKYVEPDSYGPFKIAMELESQRLRRNNANTAFDIKQFNTNVSEQVVHVTGLLRRMVNGVDVGEPRSVTYRAQFRLKGGRISLSAFKEVPNVQSQPGIGAVAADPAGR
jgi:conjugal transfer pilus assembly protein TraE